MPLFVEENTERVKREKDAQIMVVIGNPPYNVGQKNQNDNNKNRSYPVIDGRIRETYAKDSKASNINKLYDAYVKFFRWAADRLQGQDGIVCLVSNNSFIDQITFDGMRKQLLQDFTQIYHLDLHGNVRKNPRLSGTTHNVFGIQVGVGITIAVRASTHSMRKLYYFRVPEYWHKMSKLNFLKEKDNISRVEWQELQPDAHYNWLTEGLSSEFGNFIPLGAKEAKLGLDQYSRTIFKTYSLGVATGCDEWAYGFNRQDLLEKVKRFSENYNNEVARWTQRRGERLQIDAFVNNNPTFMKWTDRLKEGLYRKELMQLDISKVRESLCRPFSKRFLYFDHLLNQRRYQQHLFFPTSTTESENIVICVPGPGNRKDFGCLATNMIPRSDLAFEKAQCFPYYTYREDGTNRQENITDWVLAQFQTKYGLEVTKWQIFHYVYAMLHHPQYRELYRENLKLDLPYIPLLHRKEAFQVCVAIGQQLMDIHLHYEQTKEYPLKWIENRDVLFSWRVEKMRLTPAGSGDRE